MKLKAINLFFLLGACVSTPQTERKQLMLVSEKQMQQLGDEAFTSIKKESKEDNDTQLKEMITTISRNLFAVAGVDFNWEVKVFKDAQTNAFCLPGGKIGVFTGMLDVAPTNAAMAAVLGHEIAHATARHSAERMSQALLAQGALVLTDVSLADKKYRQLVLGALGVGVQFGVLLPYSRAQESEADHIGTLYMARAGYNPEAAVEVWQNMSRLPGGKPPEFLSTHPDSEKRMTFLKRHLARYQDEWRNAKQQIATVNLKDASRTVH